MSHMAGIDIDIVGDHCIPALSITAEALGLKLEKRSNFRWYGRWMNDYHAEQAAYNFGIKPEEYGRCAEYVITDPNNPGCYEVGVVRRRDGKPGFILLYDFFSGGHGMTEKLGGATYGKLKQVYTAVSSQEVAKLEDMKCEVHELPNGHVQIRATRRNKQALKG